MKLIRPLILALLASGLIAPPLYAQNVTGAWSFRADVKRKGCTLSGNMTISEPAANGTRTCSFVSTETCEAIPDLNIKMDQACKITPQAESYIMRSTVVGTLTEGYNVGNYLADHFIVKPTSPKEMKGIWQDTRYSAPVIFWRDDALPVS